MLLVAQGRCLVILHLSNGMCQAIPHLLWAEIMAYLRAGMSEGT